LEVKVKNVGKVIGLVGLVLVVLLLLCGTAMLTVGRFGVMGRGIRRGIGMMSGLGMRSFGSPFGFGFGHPGILLMLLVFGLVIAAVVAFIVWVVRSEQHAPAAVPTVAANAPLELLRERYARGEITKEQFDLIRHDLETGSP
jgi:putative membrane protein